MLGLSLEGRRKRKDMALGPVDWSLAKRTADNLTRDYLTPPIPVLDIAEQVVTVDFREFTGPDKDVLGVCDFSNDVIYVNSDDNYKRQKFTIAHELGHYLIHRDYFMSHRDKYYVFERNMSDSESKNDPREKEANFFAANLLVPEKMIRPLKHLPADALADLFGVSKSMMEFRLKNVG